MSLKTRPVSWIRAALRDFESFPEGARSICLAALTIAAEGGKADLAKPMHSLGSGVFEIALRFKGDAFRVVYAVQFADEIWVVHAFQKKSTRVSVITESIRGRTSAHCNGRSGFGVKLHTCDHNFVTGEELFT